MLNRQVRSPSWMRGSKSRGTAMSRITIVPAVAPGQRSSSKRSPRHDRLGRPGRAQDDVGLRQGVVELVPRHRLAAAARRHRRGLLRAAVGHQDALRLQAAQVLQRQLAHLAGADDEDRLVVEVVEHLADVIDGDARHGDVAAGDAGLGADALGDDAGVLEQGVQQRPGACRAAAASS